MSTHTPGPWTAERVASEGPLVYYRIAAPGTIKGIAGVYRSTPESQANARLIAAAPALLEALKAQQCPDCLSSEPDDMVCDHCRMARAAIALAEGRNP